MDQTNTFGVHSPMVIDLKKQSRKRIRQLRKGRGRLLRSVQDTISQLQEANEVGTSVQPVIVIVRQKPRRRRWW
jgi:hypothetical protein